MFKSAVLRALAPVTLAALAAVPLVAQHSQDTVVRNHITVTQHDISAAGAVKSSSYHVMPAHVPGAKALASALNEEGARPVREAEAFAPRLPESDLAPETVPSPANPFLYPADLTKSTGPTLGTTINHALYLNHSGTVAANWGNPEGFLADLNLSTFIHLTDQYTGKTTNGRYPVGANANITYSFYGNVLYTHELWAIVHAAAKQMGSGTGHIYHVFLPNGMDTCFDFGGGCYSPDQPSVWAFCAYHDAVSFGDIGTVLFTVEPYQNVAGCAVQTPSPNGQLADSTNSVLSHEFFEAITDPIPSSGYVNRTTLDLDGYEIGDECQPLVNTSSDFLTPTFKINNKNYEVQLEYSNTYHACVMQP